ncbi:penicillin-binding protein 2 [Peribacillus cavernae]|uniref:Penicillin-binding protein 2 n=1 Tax=Peribacillus cavernae TaxID=1674310 RepID=A0A433HWC1_9BACI|nr:penicillin-binding transpeptidase domain-containing protein [Peribacillus cavernae]MDQ0218210.1 cell division protein FtsI/penicillin-binding protein 2 [Peribacillus cavernae]RUQ32650.1 penicillin-binding protein 2 [Peribacillus cavernae]
MISRRMKGMGIFLIALLIMLVARLVQVQLVSTESFSKHHINLMEASVNQRSQVLTLDDGRGEFYDHNGDALAHEEIPTLILFPFLKKMTWPSKKVADIIGVPEREIIEAIEKAEKPFPFGGGTKPIELTPAQSTSINELKVPGVFAVREKFYDGEIPAAQLIGTTTKSEAVKKQFYPDKELSHETRVGSNGLQRTFDEFLFSEGDSKLVFHVDGFGGPLFGVDVKYVEPANPMYPVKINTTLDKTLQDTAEQLADEHKITKGGLVLLDIETNEIRALVSRPKANKNNAEDNGNKNMMLKRETPGSIFKTIVAAAAVDSEAAKNSRMFNCNVKIDGKPDTEHNLGLLNFRQSFSRSCNRTFAELAQEMADKNPEILDVYARKLGIKGKSGWSDRVYHIDPFNQLDREETGVIWLNDDLKKDKKMVAKTAIGQQDVQVTPLAIANMMATIARGGEKKMVKAVSKVEFNNGTTVFDFPDKNLAGDTISPYTAMKLQELLRGVVTDPKGTGAYLKDLPYEVAGKSGTAQTNIKNKELNKWFAGYFPYKSPKYALVAVSYDTNDSTPGMTRIFADMVKEIYKMDNPDKLYGQKE